MVREYTITYKNNNLNEDYFKSKQEMLDFLKANNVTLEMANKQIAQIFYKDYKNGEETWVEVLFDKSMNIDEIQFPLKRIKTNIK